MLAEALPTSSPMTMAPRNTDRMVIHHRFRHPALAIVAALACSAAFLSLACSDDDDSP